MSGAWLEWIMQGGCLLLIGAVIKLIDDYLDADYDILSGQRTLAVRLGRAALPYGVLCSVLAVYLNPETAIAVFLGSYSVGMVSQWRERFPTHLSGYAEIGITVALSIVLVGWQMALWGVCVMAVVDWLDDLIDLSRDRSTGQHNVAISIGVVETVFLTLTALFTAVMTEPVLTALAFCALTILTMAAELTTKHLWRSVEEEGEVGL